MVQTVDFGTPYDRNFQGAPPQVGGLTPRFFGASGSGNETAAIQMFFDYIVANKVQGVLDRLYQVDRTIRPNGKVRLLSVPGAGLRFDSDGSYTSALDGTGAVTGKLVLFDTTNTTGSSIAGQLTITTTATTYLDNSVAFYPADATVSSTEWTIEGLLIQKTWSPFWQPAGLPSVLPYTRWTFQFLHTRDNAYSILLEGVNGWDDTFFSSWRMNRSTFMSTVNRADIKGGAIFMKGGDTPTATGSINASSDQLTVSGGTFVAGQTIAINGAGPGGVILVAEVTGAAGSVLTLDEDASTTVSGEDVCVAYGGIDLDLSSLVVDAFYCEGSYITHPIVARRGCLIDIAGMKYGSGIQGLGARGGHPIYVCPSGASGKSAAAEISITVSNDDGVSGSGNNIRSFVYLATLPNARRSVKVTALRGWDEYVSAGITPVTIGPSIGGSGAADGLGYIDEILYCSGLGSIRRDSQNGQLLDQAGRARLAQLLPDGVATIFQAAAITTEDQVYNISAFDVLNGPSMGAWVVSTANGAVSITSVFATNLAMTNDGLALFLTNSSGADISVGVVVEQSHDHAKVDLLQGAGQMHSSAGWALGPGWSIGAGVATGVPDAATSALTYNTNLVAGTYRVTFEVKSRSAGSVVPRLSGGVGGTIAGTTRATTGVFHETFVTPGSAAVGFNKNPTFNGTVDNLTIVRTA